MEPGHGYVLNSRHAVSASRSPIFECGEIESAAFVKRETEFKLCRETWVRSRLELIQIDEHISKPISSSVVGFRMLHSSKGKANFNTMSWSLGMDTS